MSKAVMIARVLLGLIFVVFGTNYFFNFLPQPPMNEQAGAFIGALLASGYLFPFMKVVDIAAGIMLLMGRFVPLALVLLAPIVINIFLFHVFLDTSGMVMALVILILELFLAWAYWGSFRGMLSPAQPDV